MIYKIGLYGNDIMFLNILGEFLNNQGCFLCGKPNEKIYSDIDIRVYKRLKDFKEDTLGSSKQILIFPRLSRKIIRDTLDLNILMICDYNTPLSIFTDAGLRYTILNKIGTIKKRNISSIAIKTVPAINGLHFNLY